MISRVLDLMMGLPFGEVEMLLGMTGLLFGMTGVLSGMMMLVHY
jgi:hypothetical protein